MSETVVFSPLLAMMEANLANEWAEEITPALANSDERNSRLYEILVELYNANKAIDEKLLTAKLKQLGELESIGGMAFLASVAVAAPHAAHATEYAELIRNNSLRRQLIEAATSILKDAHAGEEDPQALMGLAEEKIFEIHDARDESSICLLYTSPSPRDLSTSRMPSSA